METHLPYSILIAEDDPFSRLMTSALLEQVLPGCQIFEAENGNEAVAMHNRYNPDLILMDVQMPEMNGFEATNAIRKQHINNHLPIIAVTAETGKTEHDKILASGMNLVLVKPFSKDGLLEVLNTWFENNKALNASTVVSQVAENTAIVQNLEKISHFDRAELLERLDNDEELLEEMLESIKGYLPVFNVRIKELLAEGNTERLKSIGHELKGAALTGGFTYLGKLAYSLEKTTDVSPAYLAGLTDEINSEINLLLSII